jgi:hypothetical protein
MCKQFVFLLQHIRRVALKELGAKSADVLCEVRTLVRMISEWKRQASRFYSAQKVDVKCIGGLDVEMQIATDFNFRFLELVC